MGNFLQSWWETDTPFLDNNPKNSRFYLQISLWVDLAYNLKAIFCWLLKMKVIYFLSFSVTDLVLENTEFRRKKKKRHFHSWAACSLSGGGLAWFCNDPGGSHVTWASAANRWPGPSACHSPWHHMASNIQEFLAYSFFSGGCIPYLLVLAQGKVPRTRFQVPSFPQKDHQAPIRGLFVFAEF